MHKTSTKINKSATNITYQHGTNFFIFAKGKNKMVILFMMKIKTNTHAEK
jgi:hypothetical protein